MDLPVKAVPRPFIHTWSHYHFGPVPADGGVGAGSSIWVSASRAYYVPFGIPYPYNAKRFFVLNGATVSGNWDVGIYSVSGERIWSAGTTAQAGTSAPQYFNSNIMLPTGTYYLAAALDNITGTFLRSSPSVTNMRIAGILMQAAAFPLPATATFATPTTDAVLPCLGLTWTDSGW